MNHTRISKILTVLFAVVLCLGPVGLANPIGTAFTYQGRLIDANQTANGLYDFQFKLFGSGQDKSVFSSVTTNSGSTGGYLNVFQYFWTEQPISTDCNYVTLWVSGDGYTTSMRYAWHIALVLSDDVNTNTDIIRCDCWGLNEGCNPNHYDYYGGTATGADGRTWKRYTRAIPSQITKNNLTIKIEHEQAAWDGSTAGSWYRLDNVYLSDASGQLIQPITNGFFAADATGTAFSNITGWDYSITSTNGVAQDLNIVDDYFFNAETQVGQTVVKDNVDVLDGYFTVELDFNNVFDGNNRWLEIGVRPGDRNDPNTYTNLSPKQKITPAPYALYAKTASGGGAGGSPWQMNGSDIYYTSGNVGIGTASPGSSQLYVNGPLHVQGPITHQTETRYYAISAVGFVPTNNSIPYIIENGRLMNGSISSGALFYAPVNLPHGATVTSMSVGYGSSDASGSIVVDFYSQQFYLGWIYTSNLLNCQPPLGVGWNVASAAANIGIDNLTNAYFVQVFLLNNGQTDDEQLVYIRFTYTINKPLP